MSRSGSTTNPTPLSGSATRKLLFPSSWAGIAWTVNTAIPTSLGRWAAHLRRQSARRRHPQTDQEVTQPVREVEESQRYEGEQVELHDRVAEDADPGVVVAIHHMDHAQRPENALHQDVCREH